MAESESPSVSRPQTEVDDPVERRSVTSSSNPASNRQSLRSSTAINASTLSVIAMQSKPIVCSSNCPTTKLVVALIQAPTGDLQLKVIDFFPSLLMLPDNKLEAEDYCRNHKKVIANLQSKQNPVEELLKQADNLISSQKPKADVYRIMAVSLSHAWRDVHGILEERKMVLELVHNCHKTIDDCLDKMKRLEGTCCSLTQSMTDKNVLGVQIVSDAFQQLKRDESDVKNAIDECVKVCKTLLEKLEGYSSSIDSREAFLLSDMNKAKSQIQSWLHKIRNRHMVVKVQLETVEEQLTELMDYLIEADQITSLEKTVQILKKNTLKCSHFGESVADCENLEIQLSYLIDEIKEVREMALKHRSSAAEKKSGDQKDCGRPVRWSRLYTQIDEILSALESFLADSSLVATGFPTAKEFFKMLHATHIQLENCKRNDLIPSKGEIDGTVRPTLSKAEQILDTYGWNSYATKGVHDSYLELKKLEKELVQNLELNELSQYQSILQEVNTKYEQLSKKYHDMSQEKIKIPTDLEPSVEFKESQESVLSQLAKNKVSRPVEYNNLQESDKDKVNETHQRLERMENAMKKRIKDRLLLIDQWIQVLKCYSTFSNKNLGLEAMKGLNDTIKSISKQIKSITAQCMLSDPHLGTEDMEAKLENILSIVNEAINCNVKKTQVLNICKKFKERLDRNFVGDDEIESLGTKYFPVLNEHHSAPQPLTSILDFIEEKLESSVSSLFSPLFSDFQKEVSTIPDPERKCIEEFENHFKKVQDRYLILCRSILEYIKKLSNFQQDFNKKIRYLCPDTIEEIQTVLQDISGIYNEYCLKFKKEIQTSFQSVQSVVSKEEPTKSAAVDNRVLQAITQRIERQVLHEAYKTLQNDLQENLKRKMTQSDLELFQRQLNDVLNTLDQPLNYGDNLTEAKVNLQNFQRLERTVELLKDKYSKLVQNEELKSQESKTEFLRQRLSTLETKKKEKNDSIMLSLDYFQHINECKDAFNDGYLELQKVTSASKSPSINENDIEKLLLDLEGMKSKATLLDEKLNKIETIATKLYDNRTLDIALPHDSLKKKRNIYARDIESLENNLKELKKKIGEEIRRANEEKNEKEEALAKKEEEEAAKKEEEALRKEEEAVRKEEEIVKKEEGVVKELDVVKVDTERSLSPVEWKVEDASLTVTTTKVAERPLTPNTLKMMEKETQFECMDVEPPAPEKIERDTVTQTIESGSGSTAGTQTETDSTSQEEVKDAEGPSFIAPLKDVVANEGERVVLECRTTGKVKELIWLKDSLVINNNPDYKTEVEKDTARLTIDEVFLEDAAIYTCRAISEIDNSVYGETSGKLVVKEQMGTTLKAPKISLCSSSMSGKDGDSFEFKFQVEGNPLPTVQWFKDDTNIDASRRHLLSLNNGVCHFRIEKLSQETDQGNYKCVATNRLGTTEASFTLQIEKRSQEVDLPKITEPLPSNIMCRAGQKVELICKYESPDGQNDNISWSKDDKVYHCSSHSRIISTPSCAKLEFTEMYPPDSGKYGVIISNSHGQVDSYCQVTVKGLLPPETSDSECNASDIEAIKPVIKMGLKDVATFEGEDVQLDCVIIGQPEPEVIWYRNGAPIKESSTSQLIFQGDKCSLLIKKLKFSDRGAYSVSAVNSKGEASSVCEVSVRDKEACTRLEEQMVADPPKFLTLLQDAMINCGENLELLVKVDSEKDAVVTWWKNNDKIEASERIKIIEDGNVYKLVIDSVESSDRGNYMVKATNASGDSKCFSNVIVKEELQATVGSTQFSQVTTVCERSFQSIKPLQKAPRFIRPLEGRMVEEGESILRLKCMVEGNPAPEINWTKDSSKAPIKTTENEFEVSFNEVTGEAILALKNVNATHSGRYTVTASNELGTSTSMADLVVRKKIFPPVFSKRLQSVDVQEGKRLHLEIDVFAKPAPEIIWERNGEKLLPRYQDRVDLRSDHPTRHSLTIAAVSSTSDEGEYKVTAVNEAGTSSSSCKVKIFGSGMSASDFEDLMSSVEVSGNKKLVQESEAPDGVVDDPNKPLDGNSEIFSSSKTISYSHTETHREIRSFRSPRHTPTEPLDTPRVPSRKSSPSVPDPVEISISKSPVSSADGKTSKRAQFLQKLKSFEEQINYEKENTSSPVPGGVKVFPSTSTDLAGKAPFSSTLLPLLEPGVSSPNVEKPPPPVIEPKTDFILPSIEPTKLPHIPAITAEIPRKSDATYFHPKKFIPGALESKVFESSSTQESTFSSHTWKPSSTPTTSLPSVYPKMPSAFVPVTSTISYQQTVPDPSIQYKAPSQAVPRYPSPPVPPKPAHLMTQKAREQGVRKIAGAWPPKAPSPEKICLVDSSVRTSSGGLTRQGGEKAPCLSPNVFLQEPDQSKRSRSPTPNKEALEMDKIWSKPIKMLSPGAKIPAPQPAPAAAVKPKIPPKPLASSPIFKGPITAPKMQPPLDTPRKRDENPLYYVSVVSKPEVEIMPPSYPQASSDTATGSTQQVFEQRSEYISSSSFSSKTQQESRSSSQTYQSFHETRSSAPDQASLPAPGEPPQFFYAVPSTSKNTTLKPSSSQQKSIQTKSEERGRGRTDDNTGTDTDRKPPGYNKIADTPRMKPTKFIPAYFSESSSAYESSDQDDALKSCKWESFRKGKNKAYRKVNYTPSCSKTSDDQSDRGTEASSGLTTKIKTSVHSLPSGIFYSKKETKIGKSKTPDDPGPGKYTSGKFDDNPLLYFKYDFGYEFGVADPSKVVQDKRKSWPGTSSYSDDPGTSLPIIHSRKPENRSSWHF